MVVLRMVVLAKQIHHDTISGLQEWWRILDFFSFHPESAHIFTWLLDDVGIPQDYRHMDGFGVHTFVLTKGSKRTYVKFHWHTDQGVANLTDEKAVEVGGTNSGHATTDLFEAIERGEHPSWTLKVQLMDPAEEVCDQNLDPQTMGCSCHSVAHHVSFSPSQCSAPCSIFTSPVCNAALSWSALVCYTAAELYCS
jgi:catalase